MKHLLIRITLSLACMLAVVNSHAQEQADTTSTERSEPTGPVYESGNTYYPDGTVYFSNAGNDYAENMEPQVRDGLTKRVIDCKDNNPECQAILERASGYALRNSGGGAIPPPRISSVTFTGKKMKVTEAEARYKAIKAEQDALQAVRKGVYTWYQGRWIYVKDPAIATRTIILSWKKKRK